MIDRKSVCVILCWCFFTSNLHANSQVTERDVLIAITKGVDATKEFLKIAPTYQLYENYKTILHYAVELNKYDVVEFLSQHKINLARKGGMFSQTPLQDAIYYRNFRIAKLLISRGSPLDVQNVNGETALHVAAKRGYVDMVQALLSAGASVNVADEEGNRAYELVPELMFEDSKELVELLTPDNNTVASMEANFDNDRVLIINVPTINKTRTITIDGRNKTIDDKIIDNKSNLHESNVGMVIN
jgi:hypothetical protein